MPVTKRTVAWTTNAGENRRATKYQAVVRDRTGTRHHKMFDLKRDAERWIAEQTAGLVTGRWADPKLGKQTLAAYSDDWLARQVTKSSTVETYRSIMRNHLHPAFGGVRLDSITKPMIERQVRIWTDSAKPATVEARYHLLATILSAAVRDKVLPETPCVGINLPEKPTSALLVPIDTTTVLQIADAIAPRFRAFVMVGAGTGMRRGELLGLTLDRVGFEFGTLRVDRQLSRTAGDSGHEFAAVKRPSSVRTIDSVADVVLGSIREHVDQFGTHGSGLIFTSRTGSPVSTGTLDSAWRRATHEVGTGATPHDLRHYFASTQLRNGVSAVKVAKLLGHKRTSETLDTYGHLIGDESEHARQVMQAALTKTSDSRATVSRFMVVDGSVSTGHNP